MFFRPPLYGQVLRQEKTQTRRLCTNRDGDRKYRVGQRLPVQKPRTPCEAHIILTGVSRERLGQITFEDARSEGYRTTNAFRVAWVVAHDDAWLLKNDLTAETFEQDALNRFEERWAMKRAWVLTFEIDREERPRFLANRNAKADYVEHPAQAMPREPEAVPASVQKRFSREGHQGWVAREVDRQKDRDLLGLEERLRLARVEAGAYGVDIVRHEAAILKRIVALESKVRRRGH